ncbi:MAG TPA: hypothetical protein VJY15_07690 [Candidatus Acidoferrum sp.]|nr:hypothetical protein [Candidatus Acidoferrum sp.]
MANVIANPKIPVGSTLQNWPNIEVDKAHPEVVRAIKLIYNSIDDHNQAFLAQMQKAQLVATVDAGAVTAVDVVSGGSYTSVPSVSAVGGGGKGATFSVNLNTKTGAIRSVKVTNGGSGYTSPPALTVG